LLTNGSCVLVCLDKLLFRAVSSFVTSYILVLHDGLFANGNGNGMLKVASQSSFRQLSVWGAMWLKKCVLVLSVQDVCRRYTGNS